MNIDALTDAIKEIRTEEANLLKFMHSLNLSPGRKVLDVGCGFGKKMALLTSHGYDVTGVEANLETVAANVSAGKRCLSVSDFNRTEQLYDVLLMSHIIEHFQPADLLEFMDGYLDRLQDGGFLIVATPLYSPYFYDDFDHVKPYQPMGIEAVFGKGGAQVQYCSRNKIELIDLWYRKEAFKSAHNVARHIDKRRSLPAIGNLFFALAFRLSCGMLGRTDGWMGLYRKLA